MPAATRDDAVYVGTSEIHGRGLFATRAIPADTLIGVFRGRRTMKDGPHVLWVTDDDGTEYGVRGTTDLRFVNHSSDPNAAFYGPELWSLRAIRPDEEITFDYGPSWRE